MPPEDPNASPGSGASIIRAGTSNVHRHPLIAMKVASYNQQKQSVMSKLVIRPMSLFLKAQLTLNLILLLLLIIIMVNFSLQILKLKLKALSTL